MSSISKKPISVVIFDRTQLYGSDVPVFSSALKTKVNTVPARELDEELSPATRRILEKITGEGKEATEEVIGHPPSRQTSLKLRPASKATEGQGRPQATGGEVRGQRQEASEAKVHVEETVLRADSFGGQTNEFAQSTDFPSDFHSTVSLPQRPSLVEEEKNTKVNRTTPVVIFESPELLRVRHETDRILTHLFPAGVASVVIPRVSIPKTETILLESMHRAGLIDQGIIPTYEQGVWVQVEEALYTLKHQIRRSRTLSTNTREKISRLSLQILEKIQEARRSLTLQRSKVSFPSITFSSPIPHVREQLSLLLAKLEVVLAQVRPALQAEVEERLRFSQLLSKVLIAGSLVLLLLTVGPMVALEANSWKEQIAYSISSFATRAIESQFPTAIPSASTAPTPTPTPNPDPEKQFQIQIPKIGVNSRVIANVDAGNEQEYDKALKEGVAHAVGTGLPGESNTTNRSIFIFGHSTNGAWNITRYNALFYALKDLVLGDTIDIWFWGKQFHYVVKETKIVPANDVSLLQPQTSKDQLILQTCWPPGTSWKRLIVIAEPVR